ncbi:MAG: hypothetical protein Q7O66_22110 [Dehalococcoidia bacterium]|nr:hypothetical protein [Dehalococcoidia bacterium]
MTGGAFQDTAQAGIAEAANLPFTTHQGDEDGQIVGVEQVEAPVTPIFQKK